MKNDQPTILTREDINRVLVEAFNKPSLGLVRCITCERMDSPMCMQDGIQCQTCFSKRIPMFRSSPVSSAYWDIKE